LSKNNGETESVITNLNMKEKNSNYTTHLY